MGPACISTITWGSTVQKSVYLSNLPGLDDFPSALLTKDLGDQSQPGFVQLKLTRGFDVGRLSPESLSLVVLRCDQELILSGEPGGGQVDLTHFDFSLSLPKSHGLQFDLYPVADFVGSKTQQVAP